MEMAIGVTVLLLALGFMPAARGVAAGINSVEEPGRQETTEQARQVYSDMGRLALMLVIAFGLLAALQMGAI